MKKSLFIFCTLFLTTPLYAATYHFSTSGSNSTGDGSVGNPYYTMTGSPIAGNGAISAGDQVLLKAGDEWCGSSAIAEWSINSNGTTTSHITVGRYGTGANPKIAAACTSTPTWTNLSGNIWYTTVSINLRTVWDEDAGKALFNWQNSGGSGQTNSNVPVGAFCLSNSTTPGTNCSYTSGFGYIFIQRWDSSNPNTHPFRLPNWSANGSTGNRGILRTTTNSAYGDYVDFVDIDVINANGVGFSVSGYGDRTAYMTISGSMNDGLLVYKQTTSGEDGSYYRDFGSTVSYNATYGSGHGQGITTYSNNGAFVGTRSEFNAMAGIDFLYADSTKDVTNSVVLYGRNRFNGLWPNSNSHDPDTYCDGCNNLVIMHTQSWGSGEGVTTGGGGTHAAYAVASEHPTTLPAHDVDIIDSFGYANWKAYSSDNTGATQNINGVRIISSALSGSRTSGFGDVYSFADVDTAANSLYMRYNIIVADGPGLIDSFTRSDFSTIVDSDYNIVSIRSGSSSSNLWKVSSTSYTLANFKTIVTPDEANTVYASSGWTTDMDASTATQDTPDYHLSGGATAIDACGARASFTPKSWLSTDFPELFPTAESMQPGRGTTQSAGTLDNPNSSMDCGPHYAYAYLYPATVTPASLTANTVTSYHIAFTLTDSALPYNGYIEITLPSGASWDSGGTTAISNVVGPNGTWSLSVLGQVLTLTRVGDGYSTMPTNISFDLSHVLNPGQGTSGTYKIETFRGDDNTKIATSEAEFGMAIAGDTFVDPAPAAHIVCNGPIRLTPPVTVS